MIQFAPIPDGVRFTPRGEPVHWTRLARGPRTLVTAGVARGLASLVEQVGGVRLLSGGVVDPLAVARERAAYDLWLGAGSPAPGSPVAGSGGFRRGMSAAWTAGPSTSWRCWGGELVLDLEGMVRDQADRDRKAVVRDPRDLLDGLRPVTWAPVGHPLAGWVVRDLAAPIEVAGRHWYEWVGAAGAVLSGRAGGMYRLARARMLAAGAAVDPRLDEAGQDYLRALDHLEIAERDPGQVLALLDERLLPDGSDW